MKEIQHFVSADTHIDFFTETLVAWERMLADLKGAERRIDIEQYIFEADSIGQKFIDICVDQAARGVRVRIVCDMVGSYSFYNSKLPDELRKKGIEIRFFNPVKPWRLANFTSNFFRDHRKVLIIDEKIAYLGGVGISERMADWRDTDMRMTGPLVPEIILAFDSVWNNVKKKFLFQVPRFARPVKDFDVLTNAPGNQRFIRRELLLMMRRATHRLYITTPYFIPDLRLWNTILQAARRGVDVRLIVAGNYEHSFVEYARQSYYSLALQAGVKLYVYQGRMMHAKTSIIDDVWATAGSFNLDNLSSVFNLEINVASTHRSFIVELEKQFQTDLTHCREIKYEEWIRRSFIQKFLEVLTWPFHSLL